MNSSQYRIYPLSENAMTLQLKPEISELQIRKLYHLKERILSAEIPGIRLIRITFHELTIQYDSYTLSYETLFESINKLLHETSPIEKESPANPVYTYTIPVCYDEEMARDKSRWEICTGQPFEELILHHQQCEYTFYMVGFLPGFLYLGGLNKELACPRLEIPRQRVLKGSVGIAGLQTGIYPMESPGGWNIIGRTPLNLFDFSQSDHTFIIQPLDKIKFISIPLHDFQELQGMQVGEFQLLTRYTGWG